MKKNAIKFTVFSGMLFGLPLIGVLLAGYPLPRYLEFPPETRYIDPTPFSWIAFAGYTVFILSVVLPLLRQGFKGTKDHQDSGHTFPLWGWIGVVFCGFFWILAWNRFPWFVALQPHTFTPLWLSFIVVINALGKKSSGRCMMTDRPLLFLLLFPTSAAFWWFFEYLNRFVQNWHYTGVLYEPWEYFLYATISFSTVLPAVVSTKEWVGTFPKINDRFRDCFAVSFISAGWFSWSVLMASGVCLLLIGIYPDILFPFLWISPLLIIVSIQALLGERHLLFNVSRGDWRPVITSALAALICGFFWEMWNYYSLARWEYSVPLVHRFEIFEMPVLGYAGYLPFGLECVVVGDMLSNLMRDHD